MDSVNVYTAVDNPEPDGDIVDDLRKAIDANKRVLAGAMVIYPSGGPRKTLLERSLEEIVKLRTVLGMTNN